MNSRQKRFGNMANVRPPKPTIQDEKVAMRIARRIVTEVNLDDFYWEPEEIEDRVLDVGHAIMQAGDPAKVFARLAKQQQGDGSHPYRWEGIDQHCRHIADEIAQEELNVARFEYAKRYF